jgi:UDP-glucose 4-epimerase
MKILVTGGAGFIASHVADAYIAEGHDVVIVDNLSMGKKENINPKAMFVQMDIRDEKLRDIFEKERFDIVNHHAAQMDVRKSVDNPSYDASVNVLGSINLLENSRKYGVKKFIFASTGGAVYGEQDYFPADEEHPQRPLSPYGITKLTVEKYLFYYHAVYGLENVILRYANVYGPRQNPHGEAGVVAIFTKKMLAHEQPIINGDGNQTRDYVFVEDVVAANLIALKLNGTHTYNIGTGIESTVNDIFRHLKEFTGSSCAEKHGEEKKGEQRRSVLTSAKIQNECGWTPKTSLRDGLKKTVEYFRQHRA